MGELTTQVRDYLDSIASPVTVEEIVAHPAAPIRADSRMRRGPLIALAAAVVVVAFGLVSVLLRSEDPQVAAPPLVVVDEEVTSDSQRGSHYAVGFDVDGELCAEAGASVNTAAQGQAVCGSSDRLAAAAFQGGDSVSLAGWVPSQTGSLTAIYNGEIRRPLELRPIPGHDAYAFGAIEPVQARFIEVQVVDDTGQIIQRYFPSIGPAR